MTTSDARHSEHLHPYAPDLTQPPPWLTTPPARAGDYPRPAAELLSVPEQPAGPTFADAVARYNRDRTAAFAEYRGATDRAWQDYLRTHRAAELEYDQAVTRAGNHYDTTVAHLA